MSSKGSDYAYVNSSKAQGDEDRGQIPQSQLFRRPEPTAAGGGANGGGSARPMSSNTPEVVAKFSEESSALESLDIGESENSMWRKHQLRLHFQSRNNALTLSQAFNLRSWIFVVIVGVIVGCVGCAVNSLVLALLHWKFNTAYDFIDQDKWAEAFFSYLFLSLFFVSIATLLCIWEPKAVGSGVSEIKSLLNGVNLDSYISFKVVLAKALGTCFSVASGLPVGKKAPMIHVGAGISALVSEVDQTSLGRTLRAFQLQDFRSDRVKTDFITFGIAAGISAVFRSPIGGVLFAMEEGASHWSAATTIKAFVCAMVAVLTVNIVFAESSFGTTETQNVFVFGEFINFKAGETNYRMWELFLFMFIGVTGGIMGGYFNRLVQFVTVKNLKDPNVRMKQYLRIFGYTVLMVLVSFILPAVWQRCDKVPSGADTAGMSQEELDLLDDLVQFQCKDGEYNQLASLYFAPAEVAMKQLFHFREYDGTDYITFGFAPLFLFFVPYILICGFLNGIPIPMGLFIPTLLAGATYGRIWGHFLNQIAPGSVADSGTYALVGAAALNGGVTRITISMTIIMLETTGNMTYLLPLMLTFICARYAGNAMSTGLYNIQIYIKDIPYIRDTLKSLGLLNYVAVSEVMARPVVTLRLSEKVDVIYNILKEKTHNGFPVVDSRGRFVGLILRKTLCSLLELKAFSKVIRNNDIGSDTDGASSGGVVLDLPERTIFYEILEKKYPNYTTINGINLTSNEMAMWIDLSKYVDTGALSVHESTSVERAHKLFLKMELRHLVVIDNDFCPIGMITRKDIMHSKLIRDSQEKKSALETDADRESSVAGTYGGITIPESSSGDAGDEEASPVSARVPVVTSSSSHGATSSSSRVDRSGSGKRSDYAYMENND